MNERPKQIPASTPAEARQVALIRRYSDSGQPRCRISIDGIVYDVSDREYALLQWGRTPVELNLNPYPGR